MITKITAQTQSQVEAFEKLSETRRIILITNPYKPAPRKIQLHALA